MKSVIEILETYIHAKEEKRKCDRNWNNSESRSILTGGYFTEIVRATETRCYTLRQKLDLEDKFHLARNELERITLEDLAEFKENNASR